MNILEYGPFSVPDLEQIQPVLEQKGIAFEIEARVQELNEKIERWKSQDPLSARHGNTLNTAHHYIHIAETELPKLGNDLENFGLTATILPQINDIDMREEYYCPEPKCEYASDDQGSCPTHQHRLVDFSERVRLRKEKEDQSMGWLTGVVFVIVIIGLIYMFL